MINAVISIFGRPIYTYITLESLNRSNIAKELNVIVLYQPLPKFTSEQVKAMCGNYKYITKVLEQTEDKTPTGAQYHSFNLLNQMPITQWYIRFENDVLFNPDWFERCMEIRQEAAKKYKVGIVNPIINNRLRIKVEGTYQTKTHFSSGCNIFDKATLIDIMKIPKQDWLDTTFTDILTMRFLRKKLGYWHINPLVSHARHIGLAYATHISSPKNFTRGFTPHPSIMDLDKLATEADESNWKE